MSKTIDESKARPDVGCTELFGVSVGRVDGFRSQPAVNTDEDMARVVLDMPKPTWRKLKKLLPPNAELSDRRGLVEEARAELNFVDGLLAGKSKMEAMLRDDGLARKAAGFVRFQESYHAITEYRARLLAKIEDKETP